MGLTAAKLIEEAKAKSGGTEICLENQKTRTQDVGSFIAAVSRELGTTLTTLEIKGCRLKYIPSEIHHLSHLEKLNLEGNKLADLPRELGQLKLKELILTHNHFANFPEAVVRIRTLETLVMNENKLERLPEEIVELSNLRTLELESNLFSTFPDRLCALDQLTTLNMGSNKLESLSESLGSLSSLEKLILRRNLLAALPEALGSLLSLHYLDISENRLERLPRSVKNLTALTTLLAQHNHLVELPDDIGGLTSLKLAKLHDNKLTSLPASIGNLHNLSELFLQENELAALPPEMGQLKSLRKLYLEYNRLQSLPIELRGLSKLVVLILHHNQLTTVPEAIEDLKQLLRLSLDNNPLDERTLQFIRQHGALALLKNDEAFADTKAHATYYGSMRRPKKPATPPPSGSASPPPASRMSFDDKPAPRRSSLIDTGDLATAAALTTSRQRSASMALADHLNDPRARRSTVTSMTGISKLISAMAKPGEPASCPDTPAETPMRAARSEDTLFDRSHSGGSLTAMAAVVGAGVASATAATLPAMDSASASGAPSEDTAVPDYAVFKSAYKMMLEQQDFSKKKKEALLKMPNNEKWKLLSQYKGSTLDLFKQAPAASSSKRRSSLGNALAYATMKRGKKDSGGGPHHQLSPEECVSLLKKQNAPTAETLQLVHSVLAAESELWRLTFIEAGGIDCVLDILKAMAAASRHPAGSSSPAVSVAAPAVGGAEKRLATFDAQLQLETLRVYQTLLTTSLKSILTHSDAVNVLALSLTSPNKEAKALTIELLHEVALVHYVGQGLVLEALHHCDAHCDEGGVAMLFAPLVDPDYSLDLKTVLLQLINVLIYDTPELDERVRLRTSFLKLGMVQAIEQLRTLLIVADQKGRPAITAEQHEQLSNELNWFEEALEDDYEELLARYDDLGGAMLESLAGDDDVDDSLLSSASSAGPCHVAKLSLPDLGRQMKLAFDETTRAAAVVARVLDKHPVPVDTAPLYGLMVSSGEQAVWLKDSDLLVHFASSPPPVDSSNGSAVTLLATVQLRPWPLLVGAPTSYDKGSRLVELDPLQTCGKLLPQLVALFGLRSHSAPSPSDAALPADGIGSAGSSDAGQDYGLFWRQGGEPTGGLWLDDTKRLSDYAELYVQLLKQPLPPAEPVLLVRPKPRPLRVKFTDESSVVLSFDPTATVRTVLHAIGSKIIDPSRPAHQLSVDDYGLLVEREVTGGDGPAGPASPAEPEWLDENSTLDQYDLSQIECVRFRLRPRAVKVVLPGDTEKTVTVDYLDTVQDTAARICREAGLDPATHVLGFVVDTAKVPTALDPNKSLKEQHVPFDATFVVSPRLHSPTATAAGSDGAAAANGEPGTPSDIPADNVNLWDESAEGNLVVDSKTGQLTAATLNQLVALLLDATKIDNEYRAAILLTYKAFTTTRKLLEKFVERYRVPANHEPTFKQRIHLVVAVVLEKWIKSCPEDFSGDSQEVQDNVAFLRGFIESDVRPAIANMATILLEALRDPYVTKHKEQFQYTEPPPKPKLTKSISDRLTLFDIDEEEIARQLTLRAYDIFAQLRPVEFFHQPWSKPKTQHLCPNIMALINLFNDVSKWVATAILRQPKVRERAKLFKRLINVAAALRDLNNFHLLVAMISGMNNSSVSRLKWTKAKLPKKSISKLKELETQMSMEGSYKNFRSLLGECPPPAIPYLGVFLTDITFIEENPDRIQDNKLVNFFKHELLYKVISNIQRFQKKSYNFQPVKAIQDFLDSLEKLDDKELYALSLACEPRDSERADIK